LWSQNQNFWPLCATKSRHLQKYQKPYSNPSIHTQGMNQFSNQIVAKFTPGKWWKMPPGENITRGGDPPKWRTTCVFEWKKSGKKSISLGNLTILSFQTRNLERQESCPGQSRFHVFSLSSLFLRWRASRNILCICRCNLTASKFPDLVLQSTAWMLGSWQYHTGKQDLWGC
jgi:hypothetical protein